MHFTLCFHYYNRGIGRYYWAFDFLGVSDCLGLFADTENGSSKEACDPRKATGLLVGFRWCSCCYRNTVFQFTGLQVFNWDSAWGVTAIQSGPIPSASLPKNIMSLE